MHFKLSSPHFRVELLVHIKRLADKAYQLAQWDEDKSEGFWVGIEPILNFLEKISCFHSPTEDHIGSILYDQEEAQTMKILINAFKQVLNNIEQDKPNVDYIESGDWGKVIAAAQQAFEVLTKNDEIYEEESINI